MKITEILLQKFWENNPKGRKALWHAMRIGLINNSLDIEGDEKVIEKKVIEKWSRWVQFLYGQCLLKQAAQENGVLPFDHTVLNTKNQKYLQGDQYIKGLKNLIDPVVKCLGTEITSIDKNIALILKLGETEGNNQIVADDNSIDGKDDKEEAKPGEFPGLLKLIKVLNFFDPKLNSKNRQEINPSLSCIFYNNKYGTLPTVHCLKFALNPENYLFLNSQFLELITDEDDESVNNLSYEEDEEGEEEYRWEAEEVEEEGEEDSAEETPLSDTTVSSIKAKPNKRTLGGKLTPSKRIMDTSEETEISSNNSRISKPVKKNRNSRYYSEHTNTTASQKGKKSKPKSDEKININCGNYFSVLTELSISQNIHTNVDDDTEYDLSIFNNRKSNFFEDDDNDYNNFFEDDKLDLIDLNDKKSEKNTFKNEKDNCLEMEEVSIEEHISKESEEDFNEIRIDIDKVPPNVPRLPLKGTNLEKFDGIYSVRGSFHIASNMPNIGHELAGYFVPMTVIEAEQLEKATVPRWEGFNFQFIQNHPRLVGFIGASLLLVVYSAVTGTQPWEASIDSLASTIATDVFGQLGSDVVEQATQIIKDILMTFYNLIAGASLTGALVIWSLTINFLSRLPTIQHGKLSATENEDVNRNNKKKKSGCWGKKNQPLEEELLIIDNSDNKKSTYGAVVKFSKNVDKNGCSLAWVEWRGRKYLIRLWDNFLLTSKNQETLLKKPLEIISKQYETLSKENEKLTKQLKKQNEQLSRQLKSQEQVLVKQGKVLNKFISERSEMSKPLNLIYGKHFNDVDLSEITLPNDPVRKNTLRNPSVRSSKKIDSDEDYTSDITTDTEEYKNNSILTIRKEPNNKKENLERNHKERKKGTFRITENTDNEHEIQIERVSKKPIKKMQVFQIDTVILKNNIQSFKDAVDYSSKMSLFDENRDLPDQVNAVVIAIENVEAVLEKHAERPKKYNMKLFEAAQQLSEALEELSDKKRKEHIEPINIISIEEMKEDKKDDDSLIFETPKENPMKQVQLLASQLSKSVQEMIKQIEEQSEQKDKFGTNDKKLSSKTVNNKKTIENRRQKFLTQPKLKKKKESGDESSSETEDKTNSSSIPFNMSYNSFGDKLEKKKDNNNKFSGGGNNSFFRTGSSKRKSKKSTTSNKNERRRITSSIFINPEELDKKKNEKEKLKTSQIEKKESSGYSSGSSSN